MVLIPRENSLGMMNVNIGISPLSLGILETSNERFRYHYPPVRLLPQ